VFIWTFKNPCGICLYCEGGAEMARKAEQAIKQNKVLSDSTSTLVDVGSLFSYVEEGLG